MKKVPTPKTNKTKGGHPIWIIIVYHRQNNGTEIAVLQKQFGITYKDAKSVIDDLLSHGDLVLK